ncbi:hypothetical protein FN976_04380 [Caenimonas sedimenti]|uniref:Uncharacterized protein n=1 Tax=Caenimonas sedimenti TaxID=2596921 RepID=A0A562ZWW3_9BURK|nr:hypothetical protein [Caenimonas sedimenti]TWO72775.1 hypothetical protein FN976_04380 [Caenimonas sedimenti]
MTKDGKSKLPPAEDGSTGGDRAARSGEGSNTALEALIRKRKQQGFDLTDEDSADNLPPALPT